MKYFVKSSAVHDFETLFVESIEESIRKLVNKSFILKGNQGELSISFFENFLVFIQIENGTVVELTRSNYERFISDRFLADLSQMENLPPRLKRYKGLGMSYFRNEIKESLKDGKIIVENNDVIWSDYNFNLEISKNITLEGIK